MSSLKLSAATVATIFLLLFSTVSAHSNLVHYEADRVSMACTYSLSVYGKSGTDFKSITAAAFDEVDRIDRLMSHYKSDSPLSKINQAAAQHPVKVEPELFDFLAECLQYSKDSGGAFDITVAPLMKAWGFFRGEGRMPTNAELQKIKKIIGFHHVILDHKNQTIKFDQTGVELDLGGIAKGYAIDRVVALLKNSGIERALISAGGSTIYGLGSPPEKDAWSIEIQDPLDARKIATTVKLKNQALSISGSSEKFFEVKGIRYSHIMDPRTGQPVMNILSVAIITDTGTKGDALDNIFYVQGVKKAKAMLKIYSATQVFFFLPEKVHHWKMTPY